MLILTVFPVKGRVNKPLVNPVKGNVAKIDKIKKTFELNILNSNGEPKTLIGRFDGEKTFIDEYALVECYSTKTMSLTKSPCSSVVKDGPISWFVKSGLYANEGKGDMKVISVDKGKGNMKFELNMKVPEKPGSEVSFNSTYYGETDGKTLSYTPDEVVQKFSGSCEGDTISATYEQGNKKIYHAIKKMVNKHLIKKENLIGKTWLTPHCTNVSASDGGPLSSIRKKYEITNTLIKITTTEYHGSYKCEETKKNIEKTDTFEYTFYETTSRAVLKEVLGSSAPDRRTIYFRKELDCISIGFFDNSKDISGNLYCTDINSPTFNALKSCISELNYGYSNSQTTTVENCQQECKRDNALSCKFDNQIITY